MICIASINKNIIDKFVREQSINKNLYNFFSEIIYNFEKNNHIRIADNNQAFIKNQLIKIAQKTDDLKTSEVITEILNLHNNFNIKIFLTSFTSTLAVESKYVDFKISSKTEPKNKMIDIDDDDFKRNVKEYEDKVQNSLISIDFDSDINFFEKEIQKTFLNSNKCNLLRTSIAKDTLPMSPNDRNILNFTSIKPSSNDFRNAMGSLYFFLKNIINIKKEGIFLNKNTPVELNIFSYFIKDQNYREVEYDKQKAEKLLYENLTQDRFLKKILNEYKVNLKFCYFCLFKPGKIAREAKKLIHLRHLNTSNGSFKIDNENIAKCKISSNNEITTENIEIFEFSKSKQIKDSPLNTTIFQNCLDLEVLEAKFP